MAMKKGIDLTQGKDMLQTLIQITKTGDASKEKANMIAKNAIKRGETTHLILAAKVIEIEEEKGEGQDPTRKAQIAIRMIEIKNLVKGK